MSKLPKLYRVVFLEIEWNTAKIEFGECVEDWGYSYHAARLVIIGGVKAWQLLHPKRMLDPYFDRFDLSQDWSVVDENLKFEIHGFSVFY